MRYITSLFLVLLGGVLSAEAAPVKSGCYALKARSTGKYLSHNGAAILVFNANRPKAQGWEKFNVVHIGGGRYSIQGEDLYYLYEVGGAVTKNPRAKTTWTLRQEGAYVGFNSGGAWLSADRVLDGVVSAKGAFREWEMWTLVPTSGCKQGERPLPKPPVFDQGDH